ncbi:MAG: hypothetical protein WCS70_11965 [Verrucomicrobiota bacterium]
MSDATEKEIASRLTSIITDAFNRSINALEDAGAIDTAKLRKHYCGIGSRYYDIVTEQIDITVKSGAPWIAQVIIQAGTPPDKPQA